MLIRPQTQTKDCLYKTNGFKEIVNDSGDKVFIKTRYACDNSGNVREEKLQIFPELNNILKISFFGKRLNKSIYDKSPFHIKNGMYTIHNLDDGKLIKWGSESAVVDQNYVFAGDYSDKSLNYRYIDNSEVYSTKLDDGSYRNKDYIKSIIYASEDNMQMGFTKSIGFINSFFSQWSYSNPFDSFVIIDGKHGTFNIKSFKYFEFMDKSTIYKIYSDYLQSISKLSTLFKRNCEIEKRNVRILIFTSAFCSVIKFIDMDHNMFIIDSKINASDHLNSLSDNLISDGYKYVFSEEANCLINSSNGDVTDKIIEKLSLNSFDYD